MHNRFLSSALLLVASGSGAFAQQQGIAFGLTYSIDWQGPTHGALDVSGLKITHGDILFPGGGLAIGGAHGARPEIVWTGGDLLLASYTQCQANAQAGNPCPVEVDALSYGRDEHLPADGSDYYLLFSVDEWVFGNGNPGQQGASVSTEGGLVGDASADIFSSVDLPGAPTSTTVQGNNIAIIDGDGLFSASGARYPGFGLVEPNAPVPSVPDTGDNLDAFDLGVFATPANPIPIYFSADAPFQDQLEGVNHTGTGFDNNFGAADILVRDVGTPFLALYAPATRLGLHPQLDDVDALILRENGQPGYQPSVALFDWLPGPASGSGASDMLLFSVRRGSAIIGTLDSIQGVPIVEGDILTVPPAPGGPPGIVISAESLGLDTDRAMGRSDDVNAADTETEPFEDCNDNGVEDSEDIGNGAADDNDNGIPDECEEVDGSGDSPSAGRLCGCTSGAPCGNNSSDPDTGCVNGTGFGANMTASGSSSFSTDDLVFTTVDLPTGQFGLFIMADTSTTIASGNGILCVSGNLRRLKPIQATGATGTMSIGPGLIATYPTFFTPASSYVFQTWYRDPSSCDPSKKYNFSNSWGITFTP